MESSLNRKKRKEILDKKRNKRQDACLEEKNLKEKLSPRMKRKEIMRQKREAKCKRRKKILSQMKGQVLKEHEVICIQQILTVRYGILESQHAYAIIVARCYGMKKD
jgi:hypothetical protein